MLKLYTAVALGLGLVSLSLAPASAAVVTLPNSANGVTLTATVADQATITVPSAIAFTVNDVTSATDATALQTVSITNVVLHDGKKVQVSLLADAANFTAPTGGSVTWAATDVSWDAPVWTGGTGTATNLTTGGSIVATSTANATTLSTTLLKFTLAAKPTVDRAGDHTLTAKWKVESVN